MAHVCFVGLDELNSEIVKLLEVVTRISDCKRLIAEPSNILLDMINEFMIFLAWVCIIKSKVGLSTVLLGDGEVKSDGLSVTNVQITIWLRWESSENLAFGECLVLLNNLL